MNTPPELYGAVERTPRWVSNITGRLCMLLWRMKIIEPDVIYVHVGENSTRIHNVAEMSQLLSQLSQFQVEHFEVEHLFKLPRDWGYISTILTANKKAIV